MKVILIRSWTNVFGRKYPMGQLMNVDKTLGERLIKQCYAKEYDFKKGQIVKYKTDFFKPKEK